MVRSALEFRLSHRAIHPGGSHESTHGAREGPERLFRGFDAVGGGRVVCVHGLALPDDPALGHNRRPQTRHGTEP